MRWCAERKNHQLWFIHSVLQRTRALVECFCAMAWGHQAQIYLLGIEQVYADMLIEIQREHIECRIEIEEWKWNWLFPSMYYEGNWEMMVIISDYTKGNRLCSVILANGKTHLPAKLQGNDLYRPMRRKIEAQHKDRIVFGKTNIINPSHGRENKQCRNNYGRN